MDWAGRKARFQAAVNAFEARASTWPLWRRLLVFLPVFVIIAWGLNMLILGVIGAVAAHLR